MEYIINLIKSLFKNPYYTGVNLDKRSEEEKNKDYAYEEIASTPNLILVKPKIARERKKMYFIFNQKSTSSCVAHAKALIKFIKSGFKANPLFTYRLRVNYSGEGMIGDDVGQIGKKKGYVAYDKLPEPSTEIEANKIEITDELLEHASEHKDEDYFSIKNLSYENLASIVNSGEPVMIYIYATIEEWSKEVVDVIEEDLDIYKAKVRHAIAILDKTAFEEKKKRFVIIQDSAWFGGKKHRELTENFINKRCYYAQIQKEPQDIDIKKPKYKFTKNLLFGMREDEDVKKLQECLAYLKIFKYPEFTGNFFGYTEKAVKEFQELYAKEILQPLGLTKGTGYVGKSTIAMLNKLFNNK